MTPPVRPTIRTVADEAGVSTATVSYVLSGRGGGGPAGISEATVQRVRVAAQTLSYIPNQAARAIRTGRTNTVLLSLTMLSDPWSLAVSEAVRKVAAPLGVTPMILADADWRQVLERLGADAVFIDAAVPSDQELLARLAARGSRLIVFNETMEPHGFDVIRSVAQPGCVLAMAHLLARHTKVACLAVRGSDGESVGGTTQAAARPAETTRFAAYRDAMSAAGLEVRADHVATFDFTPSSAYVASISLLSQADRPTAVYATTDFAAISAMNAAQRLGLTVGVDVDIIGVGNTLEGERMTPSLSSVGPLDFFDTLAALLLARATGSDAEPAVVEFPWQLFVRESAPG